MRRRALPGSRGSTPVPAPRRVAGGEFPARKSGGAGRRQDLAASALFLSGRSLLRGVNTEGGPVRRISARRAFLSSCGYGSTRNRVPSRLFQVERMAGVAGDTQLAGTSLDVLDIAGARQLKGAVRRGRGLLVEIWKVAPELGRRECCSRRVLVVVRLPAVRAWREKVREGGEHRRDRAGLVADTVEIDAAAGDHPLDVGHPVAGCVLERLARKDDVVGGRSRARLLRARSQARCQQRYRKHRAGERRRGDADSSSHASGSFEPPFG